MVEPESVGNILLDAARLIKAGEIIVFGSASLALWMEEAPRTKDVDLWCVPPERGELVQALMGELSWYHDKHGVFVEVWGPETFAAPIDWPLRAKRLEEATVLGVTLVVPHPQDVLLAKLERWDDSDRGHAALILRHFPLKPSILQARVAQSPYRTGVITDEGRIASFEAHLRQLERTIV